MPVYSTMTYHMFTISHNHHSLILSPRLLSSIPNTTSKSASLSNKEHHYKPTSPRTRNRIPKPGFPAYISTHGSAARARYRKTTHEFRTSARAFGIGSKATRSTRLHQLHRPCGARTALVEAYIHDRLRVGAGFTCAHHTCVRTTIELFQNSDTIRVDEPACWRERTG